MDVNDGDAGLRGLDGGLGDLLRRDRAVRLSVTLVIARDRTGHDNFALQEKNSLVEKRRRNRVQAASPRIVEIITPGLMAAPPGHRVNSSGRRLSVHYLIK